MSKNVKPFLGYIRQQTAKYGLKGARLAELQRVLSYYEKLPPNDCIQDHPLPELGEFIQVWEEDCPRPNGVPPTQEKYLEILGKKFQMNCKIRLMTTPLIRMNELYGNRANLAAKNEGVDWKAVSHAFRLCYQLIDLAKEHEFIFPLKQADRVKLIKSGALPWLELQDELSNLMDEAFQAIAESTLPETPDYDFWDTFIKKTYLQK